MRCTIGHHLNFTSVALIFYAASRHACDDDASKPDDDGDASKPYASSFVQLVVLGLAVVLVGALAVVSAVVWAVVLGMVILPSDHHHAHIDSPA